MGLFDRLFGTNKENQIPRGAVTSTFETLTAYSPVFTSWNGALYESELVRAAIDSRARHISKLKVEMNGSAQPKLKTKVKDQPNPWQTWAQFLYRTSTILDMQNTCFILPLKDRYGYQYGFWTVLPSQCQVIDVNGEPWLRYQFSNGKVGAVEFQSCGILTKFQYENDFFGSSNHALNQTMELINMQNQGIKEGVKSSATFRFYGTKTNFAAPEDIAEEQKSFTETNLRGDKGGVLLFPNTWKDIHQVDSKPFTVDDKQMKLIQTNVFNYFGVNEDIIQNSAIGDALDGFYEGAIEPFAIQLSEVLTSMTFTENERSYGAGFFVSSNRLQYMKTSEKVNLIRELGDRGFITINEGREMLNFEPLPEGNSSPIRGEYYFVEDEQKEDEDGNQE